MTSRARGETAYLSEALIHLCRNPIFREYNFLSESWNRDHIFQFSWKIFSVPAAESCRRSGQRLIPYSILHIKPRYNCSHISCPITEVAINLYGVVLFSCRLFLSFSLSFCNSGNQAFGLYGVIVSSLLTLSLRGGGRIREMRITISLESFFFVSFIHSFIPAGFLFFQTLESRTYVKQSICKCQDATVIAVLRRKQSGTQRTDCLWSCGARGRGVGGDFFDVNQAEWLFFFFVFPLTRGLLCQMSNESRVQRTLESRISLWEFYSAHFGWAALKHRTKFFSLFFQRGNMMLRDSHLWENFYCYWGNIFSSVSLRIMLNFIFFSFFCEQYSLQYKQCLCDLPFQVFSFFLFPLSSSPLCSVLLFQS